VPSAIPDVASGALQWTSRLLLDPLLATLFPTSCAACGVSLSRPTRGPLCDECWDALPRHRGPICGCGLPLPEGVAGPCGRCRRALSPLTRGYSLGPYQGSLRLLLHELKYRGRRRIASRLAELIWADPAARPFLQPGAVIVPVPLHPRRLAERGFNQSELLAAALAKRAGFSLRARVLVRRKDTPPQTGLSAAQRRRNVAGAFAVRERPCVHQGSVVLVDDVLTTGATARACADALLAAGAASVDMVTVARVA
jgi:ComF family protein